VSFYIFSCCFPFLYSKYFPQQLLLRNPQSTPVRRTTSRHLLHTLCKETRKKGEIQHKDRFQCSIQTLSVWQKREVWPSQ
jgi:hypothetical protein